MATTETPDDSSLDTARSELCDAIPVAAATMRELLDAEDDRVRLRAAEAILDRAGITKAKSMSSPKVQREVGDDPDLGSIEGLNR